jgi:hypothetical protein
LKLHRQQKPLPTLMEGKEGTNYQRHPCQCCEQAFDLRCAAFRSQSLKEPPTLLTSVFKTPIGNQTQLSNFTPQSKIEPSCLCLRKPHHAVCARRNQTLREPPSLPASAKTKDEDSESQGRSFVAQSIQKESDEYQYHLERLSKM